jgi:hypothetical protein
LPTPVVGGVANDGYTNRVRWNLSVVLICISRQGDLDKLIVKFI